MLALDGIQSVINTYEKRRRGSTFKKDRSKLYIHENQAVYMMMTGTWVGRVQAVYTGKCTIEGMGWGWG
jgi:hypothetical protein